MMVANQYERLIAAGARLSEIEKLAYMDEGNTPAASAILQRNRSALQAARRALGQQCAVPVRQEEAFFAEHCDDFSHLINLARGFRTEALLAASKNDHDAAAKFGIDILELANAARRGGLVADLQVGNLISSTGIEGLRKLRARFDHGARRFLMEQLHRLEVQREPFSRIVERDDEWEKVVRCEDEPCDFLAPGLFDLDESDLSEDEQRDLLQLLQGFSDLPKTDRRSVQLDQDLRTLAYMRMLIVDFAIRDLYDVSGSFPDNLESLIPRYLPDLPADPYTESSFLYRRVRQTFCLYSTGPKSRDGGGQFAPWPSVAAGCADLCLDAEDYWSELCAVPQHRSVAQRLFHSIRSWIRQHCQ